MLTLTVVLIFSTLSCVFATNSVCTGKYYIPLDEKNFTILKRDVSNLEYENLPVRPIGGRLKNTGQTIVMEFFYRPHQVPVIWSGPFGDEKYKFSFMYFHWIGDASVVERTNLILELHMVFTNVRYVNYEVGSKHNLGILIIAYRHVPGETTFTDEFYEYVVEVQNPNQVFDLNGLETPPIFEVAFYTDSYNFYVGKSTFPHAGTCSGDVIWLEFNYVISITPEEMEYFRNLKSNDDIPLMNRTKPFKNPNSPIYKAVAFDSDEGNFEPFEGFAFDMVNDTSTDLQSLSVLNAITAIMVFCLVV
ncbi:carbonic anhydrase 2-like [Musca autumnalis]|uniref:carbonic anhydrase 2-like n=1 Tax=Musca autumnalis TaxID=221902 RepID=UPI003CE83E7B